MSKRKPTPESKPAAGEMISVPAKDLLERMGAAIDALHDQKREAELTRERFEGAIELMTRKLAYLDKLAAELLTAPGRIVEGYNAPDWEQAMLREALGKANFDDLKTKGATDEQIATRLSKSGWPDYLGYRSSPGIFYAVPKQYGNGGYKPVTAKTTFFIATNGDVPQSIILHERTGAALFREIRRLLSIPEPQKPAKAAAKSKPAAKKKPSRPSLFLAARKKGAARMTEDPGVAETVAAVEAGNLAEGIAISTPAKKSKNGSAKRGVPVLPDGEEEDEEDES